MPNGGAPDSGNAEKNRLEKVVKFGDHAFPSQLLAPDAGTDGLKTYLFSNAYPTVS